MYKVFFNDSFLIITSRKDDDYKSLHAFQLQSFNQIEKWIFEAENASPGIQLVCLTDTPELVWNKLLKTFKRIDAAGGLVKNKAGKYLFIFRRGKWDLPKGKIDIGETTADAAIREVVEETGLKKVTIEKPLNETYHLYRLKGKMVLKKTYWFLMSNGGSDKLIPQTDEDIELAGWYEQKDIPELLSNIFGSVKDIVYSELGIKANPLT